MLLGTRTNLGDFFVELWAVHHRKSVKTLRGCARVLQRQWTSIGNNSPYSLVGCYPGNPLGGTPLRPRCSKTQSPHFRAGTALRCWILCLRKLLYFPSFHKNVKIHSYTVLSWERQNVIMWRSEDPNNQRRALWGQCSLFFTPHHHHPIYFHSLCPALCSGGQPPLCGGERTGDFYPLAAGCFPRSGGSLWDSAPLTRALYKHKGMSPGPTCHKLAYTSTY